jgi:chromosome segregation ATPase
MTTEIDLLARAEAAERLRDEWKKRAEGLQVLVDSYEHGRTRARVDGINTGVAVANDAARETIAALESTVADLNARLGEAERERDDVMRAAEEHDCSADAARAELAQATARADEADARLTEAMARLAAMREALQAMRAEARTAPHFALAAMHAADAALSDEPGAAAAFLERVRAEAHRAGVEQAAVECEFHASQWTGATTKILLVQAARIRALASPAPLPATPSEETPT